MYNYDAIIGFSGVAIVLLVAIVAYRRDQRDKQDRRMRQLAEKILEEYDREVLAKRSGAWPL